MAKFEGVKWANKQLRYLLDEKKPEILEMDSKVYSISKSIHYGIFLAFEGIRFFCRKKNDNQLELTFLNLHKNLERFQRGISFNLGAHQQNLVPTIDELYDILLKYFKDPSHREFLTEMAEIKAQGYLRPFTVDEELSIGVTFPNKPSIRIIACRYERYLGEPFTGVVIPYLIRACSLNGTGNLKLGVNYLMSLKAVDEAKKILPEAGSALFLDDRFYLDIRDRNITEWDSSCCLFAFQDGTIVKIPESNLILPSITIQGIKSILIRKGIKVEERNISYGELIDRVNNKEVVAICSVGTAGILNRCKKLLLIDNQKKILGVYEWDEKHELFNKLGEIKEYYWKIYQDEAETPPDIKIEKFII
ncbi:aminotransferase class IV [Candidatus Aminicenantes bacterium AC-335-A11]|jgi:branched-subunit amino acid aminotransferase/4-amino-4-deoxychorismate lyase|nr:aminotransferase class IV [SCandidatus Aminicenantes bacterium Aminicenantia_JdfR_composite]MCP2597784.1 aminotransferase class IV [Candidatus Aminicenantes bacterium AC-335-L06]MCP2618465.1 aminotransferase class IV [Candidatus Aminicenantes bacterium AC-335-A11]MCP2620509.1 aminotransferase class IV [Candidatus Aminicenantes bacterium AC-334-E05]